MEKREKLSSRLGFIMLSAGCAIGLGNVWRFPYITGKYGGGAFVLIYLIFLVTLTLPILSMEFAVGRASRKSIARSFHALEPEGTKWHIMSYFGIAGNYMLMMFYTVIGGWMLYYVFKFLTGHFQNASVQQVAATFDSLQADPAANIFWMGVIVVVGFAICSFGLQNGVEKITKVMMICLLGIIAVLCIRSVTLDGAMEGIKFYLVPDFKRLADQGIGEVVYAAMSQAFFTISVGMGSMAVFGSYINKDRRLFGESIHICVVDTLVAFFSGLIIFPACSAFGVDPGEGPGLIFVTIPNIFNQMAGGRWWGTLFFIFMSFAAFSTVLAVFENIISFAVDLLKWSRKKAAIVNMILVFVLAIPCALGTNVLSWIQPLGEGSDLSGLFDFIIASNILPLGSIVYLMFCTRKSGWGWDNFIEEANGGKGVKFPVQIRFYATHILPIIILFIFVMGYITKFFM